MNELSLETQRAAVQPTKDQRAKDEPALPASVVPGKGVPESGREIPREPPSAAAEKGGGIDRAVSTLNDYVQSQQRDLRFSLDSELGRPVVRVLDSSTQEVIRQIPSEVALRLARNVKETRELIDGGAPTVNTGSYGQGGADLAIRLLDTKV